MSNNRLGQTVRKVLLKKIVNLEISQATQQHFQNVVKATFRET